MHPIVMVVVNGGSSVPYSIHTDHSYPYTYRDATIIDFDGTIVVGGLITVQDYYALIYFTTLGMYK